jgi:hypothetical protein
MREEGSPMLFAGKNLEHASKPALGLPFRCDSWDLKPVLVPIALALAGIVVPQTMLAQQPTQPTGVVRQASYDAPLAPPHPLAAVVNWAQQEATVVERNVTDYSATLISRERCDGKLSDYETVFIKVRHRPFSVYAYFVAPSDRKGNEAIFVEGQNGGKLLAHTTGVTGKLLGTVKLDPLGTLAMKDQRHPISELGMVNICRRLAAMTGAELRLEPGLSQVQFLPGVKVGDRPATCVEVRHPTSRNDLHFYLARLFVDDALKLPIRFEQYDWPRQPGAAAELVEEYNFSNLKMNNGFGDADFSPRNPQYAFGK